jgi:hypothetical protein
MKSLPHKSIASGLYRLLSQGALLALGMLPLAQTSAEDAPVAANTDASALPASPSWMPPAPAASAVETATPQPEVATSAETAPAPVVQATPAPVETAPAPAAAVVEAAPAPVAMVQPFANSISVADMGQKHGLTLSGGQLQSGIIFTLPTDQVITNAKLSLALKISPALIARNTTLELMLNGQPLGSLPLSEESSAGDLFELDIPSAMVVSRNNLSFRVHDNNTMACEKDQSDKYWVTVLPTSHINLEGQQLNTGRDLGKFPRPFFDSLEMQESTVPMAFTSSLQPQDVSAAAMVASYLGVLSDYRGVDFPVVLNDLPQQSGIVFGKPGDKIGSLTLPASQGPRIQLIDNPNNPVYKLLLITGNDENQLRQAAYRLVSAPLPANTESLDVTQQTIPARQPYDAPHWIDTSRPVTLGELVARDQSPLTATGIYHNEIHVPFRAAPDLFMWDGHTIPVKIDYRFPTENWIDEENSQLNVSINGTFLRNLTVNKVGLLESVWRRIGFDSRQESYNLQLQPYLIYGDNQLAFYFDIQPKKDAPCSIMSSDNIKSRIDPNSYIDLSNSYHFAQLPNLSYFVGASFPFSKQADFADTLMLLPEAPSAGEIHTLLNMAARAGSATGVPVNHVEVAFGLKGNEQDNPLFDRDILAISTLGDSPFNQQLLHDSPFAINNSSLSVKTPDQWQSVLDALTGDWYRQPLDADRYLSSTGAWRGFVSYRSPWSPSHVVVVATGTDDQQLLKIHSDLKSSKINAGVRGDLAIVTDENGIRSFTVGKQFPTGQMPWYMMVIWYASSHIVILSLITVGISLLLGLSLYVLLARHAAKRLGKKPTQ